MNTIQRPRRRPRVRSVNFRALWWLVVREAAWCVACRHPALHSWPRARQSFGQFTTFAVVRIARRYIAQCAAARYYP